jgi:RNase P subunit RPR2
VAITAPDRTTRWRCSRCGNLTRFDVVRSTRAKQYWHFDLAGDPAVEQEEALHDEIESVICRWCGAADGVETVPRAADA